MTEEPRKPLVPIRLTRDGDFLVIDWNDGAIGRLTWSKLREECLCALCSARRTEPPSPASLPILRIEEARPIEPTAVRLIGNYAYSITFNDGHASGIYTFECLRRLGDAAKLSP